MDGGRAIYEENELSESVPEKAFCCCWLFSQSTMQSSHRFKPGHESLGTRNLWCNVLVMRPLQGEDKVYHGSICPVFVYVMCVGGFIQVVVWNVRVVRWETGCKQCANVCVCV